MSLGVTEPLYMILSLMCCLLFLLSITTIYFETGSHYVALSVLELLLDQAVFELGFSCLSLLSAGVKGVCRHAWP